MTKDQIIPELTQIFCDVFDRDDIVLTPHLTADDVDEWDSFHHINLIVATEKHFGIKFRVAETEGLKNVGDFVELICSKSSR